MMAGEVRADTGDIMLNAADYAAYGTSNGVTDCSGITECRSSELDGFSRGFAAECAQLFGGLLLHLFSFLDDQFDSLNEGANDFLDSHRHSGGVAKDYRQCGGGKISGAR